MKRRSKRQRFLASFVRLTACTALLIVLFGMVRFALAVGVTVAAVGVLAVSYFPRRRRDDWYECAHCGYDLRGTKGMCPECGKLIPPGTPHGIVH